MDKEVELILTKLRIVSEEKERGMYLCDKEHSKLLLDYITNLQENARGQVNDYFKDKYADEVLKNAKLQEENEKLKEEVLNLQQKLMYLR